MRVASAPQCNGFVRLAHAVAAPALLELARLALAIGAVEVAEALLEIARAARASAYLRS